MKAFYKLVPLIFVIAVLAGCSMGEELATIRLSLGQAETARAVSLSDVSHTVTLSGPTGSKTAEIGPGGGSVSFAVAPGTWNISVTAYYQGEVYATGSATAEVKAGKTTSVSVQMTVVYMEAPTFPTDLRPLLSAQGFDLNIASDFYSLICVEGSLVWAYAEPGSATPILGTEDFTWQWNVNGTPVKAGVDPLYPNEYEVQPGDVDKNVTVTVTHPDYQGSVTLGPVLVCRGLDSINWPAFADQLGSPKFPDDGNYVLLEDISTLTPGTIVGGFLAPFNGTFDGNGNTIDLVINSWTMDGYMGLFALIGPSGTVKNLNINAEINVTSIPSDTFYFGAVAGKNQGKIFNVFVRLNPSGINIVDTGSNFTAYIGGIAGWNENAISNCSVDGTSSLTGIFAQKNTSPAPLRAGGIVGWNAGTVHHCWTLGVNVNCQGSYLGTSSGSIAGNSDTSIQNCVAIGPSDITGTDYSQAGRIWGTGNGIGSDNNYSDVDVTQTSSPVSGGLSSNRDGEDIAPTLAYNVESWWTDTAGWDSVWGGWDADEAKPWYWGYYNMPSLWFN